MNLSTIIMGLVMLIICALPFILSGRNRIKNEQTLKKSFFELVQKNNTTVLQSDFWYKTAIGINTTNQQLFFYKNITDRETSVVLNLFEYQKCRVVKLNDSSNHTDILQLVLIPNVAKKPEIILEFYNAEFNPALNGEILLVDKWSKLINEAIYNTIKLKKAV